ncbi:MAG: 30S ribosomal protein S20 [Candidatus Buchananbacteria bacterium]|nr:30S ribosomal protein S20 [Candidatus Buchananbacteria bacterium]
MPIKKSAMKALRQNKTRALRNLKVKRKVKELIKESTKLIEAKEKSAADKVKAAVKSIDKAVQNKVLKKNTGARRKSRLMKKLNKIGK